MPLQPLNEGCVEPRVSSRKSPLERRIDEMLGTLQPGDRLLELLLGQPDLTTLSPCPQGARAEAIL